MSWTAPRTFVTGEIETAAIFNTHLRDNLNFLRSGVFTQQNVTAGVGPTSGTTELVLATITPPTFDGSTPIELTAGWYNITKTVAGDNFNIALYDGATAGSGTQLENWITAVSATSTGSGVISTIITPTAGVHTYTLRIFRTSGTGTASLSAGASTPCNLRAKQVN